MHTALVMAGGFVLLGICLLVGKLAGNSRLALARAALVFLPLWLIGSGINMWVGVATAGYTVKEELPIFGVTFAVPAAVALIVWWGIQAHLSQARRFRRRACVAWRNPGDGRVSPFLSRSPD